VFFLFRLAYEAFVVLFLYESYQRWKMRHLFRGSPTPADCGERRLGEPTTQARIAISSSRLRRSRRPRRTLLFAADASAGLEQPGR